jgi:hypothetical protein
MEVRPIEEDASILFPNIPEEVRLDWIVSSGKNASNPWPPRGAVWNAILLKKDIEFWRNTTWTKESINLETALWGSDTRQVLESLGRGFYGDPANFAFGTSSEKDRVLAPMKYLFEHGTFPKPISVLVEGEGCSLADGFHRLEAWRQARILSAALERQGGSEQAGSFLETLRKRWGVQTIAPISSIQTVWVARPN